MHISRKIAIPVISLAALMGAGGIAYANVTPTPTPSVTPTVNPLPANLNRCYRATDVETLIAPGHRPVRETVPAIVCITRNGTPVVFIDSNGTPFPTPFGPRR